MDSVVKVDSELLKRVEEFIEKNRLRYSSKKQVVNLALVDFLKKNSLSSPDESGEEGKKKGGRKLAERK
jgi:hypothetical protein